MVHVYTIGFQKADLVMWGSVGRSLAQVSRRESLVSPLAVALSEVSLNPSRGYLKPADIPLAKYGGRHTVTMLPGDGIGPEMMSYVKEVFRLVVFTAPKISMTSYPRYAGAPIDFEMIQIDPKSDDSNDLNNAISSVKRNGCAIKGNIETDLLRTDIKSRNVEMRNQLDLFVNIVHGRSQPGVSTRHEDIDIVMMRQNTEGEYAMMEHENVPGVVESLKIMTDQHAERLCRYSYEWARANGRKKVTLIHKANIMKVTDGLFLEVCRRVSKVRQSRTLKKLPRIPSV